MSMKKALFNLTFKKFSSNISFKKNYDFLRLNADGNTHDFHYFWLRHNCKCFEGCNHPKTKERVINTIDIDMEIVPKDINFKNNLIDIEWNNGHKSTFQLDFLLKHSYAVNRGTVEQPHNTTNDLVVDFKNYNSKKDYMKEVNRIMKSYGLVIVKNRGLDTEDIILDFGGNVVESCFGRIEDLKTDNTTNKNNDQLGYTNAAVDLHTDLPFIDNPPEFQLLQCIKPAQKGGENYFVNAVALANYLKFIDKTAFDILTTFEVSFHRQLSNYTSIYNTPIIKLNDKGEPYQVRSSYFTYAPFKYDFHQMEAFYRAYSKLTKMSLFYKYNATLSSGDFVLYNNHTMFHARTAFIGDRHMRGIYFSGEQIKNVLNNI